MRDLLQLGRQEPRGIERGARVVFARNDVVSLPGERELVTGLPKTVILSPHEVRSAIALGVLLGLALVAGMPT